MKITLFFAALALLVLEGCAVQQPYGVAPQQPFDPYQWHNVPSANYLPADQAGQSASVEYSNAPVYVQPGYYSQPAPAYIAQPYYSPYYAPYYAYPALSIGLGFGFGSWYGGHHGGWGHGGYRGGRGHR